MAKIEKTPSSKSSVLTYTLKDNLDKQYSRVEVQGKLLVDNIKSNTYFSVSDSSGNNLARIELYSTKGTICVRNYGGTNNIGYYGFGNYSANTWYNIKLVFYPAQQRYNVYVDDVEIMSDVAYSTINGLIREVQVGFTNTDTGNVYFDDIKVTTFVAEPNYTAPALNITTMEGVKPEMPELVNITFEDGFVDSLKVDWSDVGASSYATEGEYTVNGVASSFRSDEKYNVKATINVRKNSSISYYVDPINGSDENAGTTSANAFKNIQKAQEAVRLVNKNMTGDINIYLMDGTYQMTSAMILNSSDSGSNGYYVHWRAADGAKPIFSGGKEVNGWKKVEGKSYYVTSVPESKGYLDYFRQLYVDGERATRSSSSWINPTTFVSTNGTYTGLKFKTSDLKEKYTNVEDIIIGHNSSFKYDEWHVSDIEYNGTTATISCAKEGDGLFSWRANTFYCSTSNNYMIINAFEELDSEGEWYLDRANDLIYYYPYEGQNMDNAASYVTVMDSDQLIQFEGTTSDLASNIILDGISFEYSNWLYTKDYSIGGSQAEALWGKNGLVKDISYGYEVPGAIRLNHTKNIQIINNTFSHLAACGIHVYNDTSNTLIEGNATFDTTGAGILVGSFCGSYLNDDRVGTDIFSGNNMEGRVSDTLVKNNVITDTGRDFLQATGISIMAALRTTVMNNEVDNTAYMGIHTRLEVAGYYLTRTDGVYNGNSTDTTLDVGQNIIAYNHVKESNWAHKYGMNDNASIYNFGPSNGTLIYRNNVESASADSGMYNDDNSHNVIWQENVVNGKNLYISERCVDRNTILVKDNYNIGDIIVGSCISTGNTKSATSEGATQVKLSAGIENEYISIISNLPDTSTYHNVYGTYENLNRTGGKITKDNIYSVNIIDAVGTNTQSNHQAENVYDGYTSTYWGSGTAFPENIVLTLEEEASVNNIETYWFDPSGRYYQYRIYTSTTGTDNNDWKLAVDATENTTKGFTRDYINNQKVKYIKIEITKSSLNSAAIREVVVNKQASEPTGIEMDKSYVETEVGRKINLEASVIPSNAEQKIVWTTTNPEVAIVDNGIVTAVGVGTSKIKATTVNGYEQVCEIKVVNKGSLLIPKSVETFTFENSDNIICDLNGNVSVESGSGKNGTGGLVIKDTNNALQWNGGVQSIENSAIRDNLVSGKVKNPLKGNINMITNGITISYDRYMRNEHNGFESIVRFGDLDMTIQSGWFMFEPNGWNENHFNFNRDVDTCVATTVGKWVTETYTFDPKSNTATLYRDGVLVRRESPETTGTQISEGEISKMLEYLTQSEDITFGGAASWFSTLGVTIDNFALFDTALDEEQVYAYANRTSSDNEEKVVEGQIVVKLKDELTKEPIVGAEFEIRNEAGNVIEIITTDINGNAVSKKLDVNGTKYYVVQIKTADNYKFDISSYEVIFSLKENEDTIIYTLNLTNRYIDSEVPQTGDVPYIWMYLGMYLSSAGICAYRLSVRRKKVKNN